MGNSDDAIFIDGPAGKLEAIISTASNTNTFNSIAIVCHPHPLYEGSLHNKVAFTLARTFAELGVPAIRFNFRGVGKSDGSYAGGIGETDDLLAIVDFVGRNYPGKHLWLGGFSFGAYIAFRVAESVYAERLIMISPCVNLFDFNTITLPNCPWLVIHGKDDEIVPFAEVTTWLESLYRRPEFVPMNNVGHFYHGRLGELRSVIENEILRDIKINLATNAV